MGLCWYDVSLPAPGKRVNVPLVVPARRPPRLPGRAPLGRAGLAVSARLR
jgi:hypothetical protein